MKRVALLTVVLSIFIVTAPAFAKNVTFSRSADTTAEDINLVFKPEKTKWEDGYIKISGTIRNATERNLRYVKIYFTIKNQSGKFIARESTYADPSDMGPGQVGYIENYRIDCEAQFPSKIEYLITAR